VLAGGDIITFLQCNNFTKWMEAFPIKKHTAPIVARILFEQIFMRFETPLRILTDGGPEFESTLFAELCKLMQIDKVRSTLYHPPVGLNGQLERFHRTLNSILGKIMAEDQRDWNEQLPAVMAAYLATRSMRPQGSPLTKSYWGIFHKSRKMFCTTFANKQVITVKRHADTATYLPSAIHTQIKNTGKLGK